MLNPFFAKPPPLAVPDKPTSSKKPTFGSSLGKSLWSQRPAPKPTVKDKPGFLEKNMFRRRDSLISEIRKDSYYKAIPYYGKKLTVNERMNLVKELEKVGRAEGGLSGAKLGVAIKNLSKEKGKALAHKEFGKARILDQKIKQAQVWQKTWDRPKN